MKLRLLVLVVLAFILAQAQGNPADGKKVFQKMRCDSCHSAAITTGGRAPHPLPDLTSKPADAIAESILRRTAPPQGAAFDEIAMASTASRLTERDLMDVVAYLKTR